MAASVDTGQAIQAVFNRCDADKSGNIDVAELGKCMRLLGMNPTEKEVQAAMESVDENKNGKLEFEEFRTLMEPRLSEWLQNDQVKILTDCFKVFDTEGTGKISKEMLGHIMTSQGDKLSEAELDRMMEAADADGDGMIDYKEFVVNHFFGPKSKVSTGSWGAETLSWVGSGYGQISNAYAAASESINAAVSNGPGVSEMVDNVKNAAGGAAMKAQEAVSNVSAGQVVEGLKDAAANAATAAGDAVTATQEAINVQAAKAAEAIGPAGGDTNQEAAGEPAPEESKEEAPAAEPAPEEPKEEAPAAEPAQEEPKEEAPAPEPAPEEPKEEAPAAEPKEEAPAPEPAPEEPKEEAPAAEPAPEEPKEEAPAAEPAPEEPKEEAPAPEPAPEEPKEEAPAAEPAAEEPKEEAPAAEPVAEEPKEEAPAAEPAAEEPKEEAPAAEPAAEEPKEEAAADAAPEEKKDEEAPPAEGAPAAPSFL